MTNLLEIYSAVLRTNEAMIPSVSQYSNTHDSLIFDTNAGEVAIISNPEVRAEARKIAEDLTGTTWVIHTDCVIGLPLMQELGTIANVASEGRKLGLPTDQRTTDAPSDQELAEELLAQFGTVQDEEKPKKGRVSISGAVYERGNRGRPIDSFPARMPDGDDL